MSVGWRVDYNWNQQRGQRWTSRRQGATESVRGPDLVRWCDGAVEGCGRGPDFHGGEKRFTKLITNARVIAYARRLGMELVGKKKWAEVSCRGSGSSRTRQARPTSNSCQNWTDAAIVAATQYLPSIAQLP